jgi:hypothetical protein
MTLLSLFESKVIEKVLMRELAMKDQVIALRKELNDECAALLVQARDAIATNQALVTKLGERIESLEKRAWLMQILGPFAFAAGLFLGR